MSLLVAKYVPNNILTTRVHIKDYKSCMKGNIRCYECNDILIAKKGSIVMHHYCHHNKINNELKIY